jgi:RNA polymerase sigma factor (sigma-70 family)
MGNEIRDSILGTIRKLLGPSKGQGAADAELLRRFVQGRDESAFELLVWRHAGLVLGVCRQVLRDDEAVEDAFQATFLVLARKAGSIARRASLPGWLHRVAFRTALKARRQADRHRAGRDTALDLGQVPAPSPPGPADEELRLLLHEEVLRLPDKYRLPIVCCYLDGKTHEQAAVELGWCKGTVAGRLARARDLLRARLARRGVELAAPALAVELAAHAAPVAAWTHRIAALVQGLGGWTTNEPAAAGLPARAVALAEGVIREMFWRKCRWAALLVVGLSVAGLGALATGLSGASAQPGESQSGSDEQERRPAPRQQQAVAAKKPADPFQEALDRTRVRRQLVTLSRALLNYHDTMGHLPPPAIVDRDGKPLLSWRVALLPFLEQDNLYKQFHLDEPWDSPHNRKLVAHMPAVYAAVVRTPRPHMTYFQYIVGPEAIFKSHRLRGTAGMMPGMPGGPSMPGGAAGPGMMGGPRGGMPGMGMGSMAGPGGSRPPGSGTGGPSGTAPGMPGMPSGHGGLPAIPASIPDGTANTILVVEAGTPVVWTKPDDVPYQPRKPLPRLGGQFASVIHVVTVDGAVRLLPRQLDERTLRAAITPAGGEPINLVRVSQSASPGTSVRQALVDRLRKRNEKLKEEAALLHETLADLKEELDSLRWAVETDRLLAQDPATAALQKENARLEKSLRETRDEARKMFTEIKRLQEEMRKRQKKE